MAAPPPSMSGGTTLTERDEKCSMSRAISVTVS